MPDHYGKEGKEGKGKNKGMKLKDVLNRSAMMSKSLNAYDGTVDDDKKKKKKVTPETTKKYTDIKKRKKTIEVKPGEKLSGDPKIKALQKAAAVMKAGKRELTPSERQMLRQSGYIE